ncbi:MAG: aminodeoxychorismate synthase, component I [Verrucomicrobiales bacterium]|nr:aminodeoxychorismate synthase, component I [Verrucomicrobiales bacterium]|tara:strand:+ start:11873 stop:13339 length:1467 start_codon:yes stop_codon:yes gene_type:complete
MRPLIEHARTRHTPETLAEQLRGAPGLMLLRSDGELKEQTRYSFVVTRPFLTMRTLGSRCEIRATDSQARPSISIQYGNPWHVLDHLLSRYELIDEIDLPFPLGGCFGYWGYDLKNFVEPRLRSHAVNDLELPDCAVGFYDSLAIFDLHLGKTWLVATGLAADGSRDETRARQQADWWHKQLTLPHSPPPPLSTGGTSLRVRPTSNFTRQEFLNTTRRALDYIRAGDIYQVNLSQRFTAPWPGSGWDFHRALHAASPAPFGAFLNAGDFQLASSSPERFLRLSGQHIQTRPIKGTRPRNADPQRDAQLAYELQSSEKERAELVMITDLLRNDLGRVCEFGSVQVPELMRLERFAQVQHLVSTVEGRLRAGHSHLAALRDCFPGGSITGAPKFRAMEIIDELEPVTRGPYTGSLGYLGFNRESQFNIAIRTAIIRDGQVHYQAGAGIVADSNPEMEYEETLAKAGGFAKALSFTTETHRAQRKTSLKSL